MSISKDYETAFGLISKNQRDIVFSLYEMMNKVTDEALSEQLRDICSNQIRIYNVTKKHADSLNEDFQDKRKENRENILGLVTFQEESLEEGGAGKCLDISAHGARIKFEDYEDVNEGERFKFWIKVFGRQDSLKRSGVIEWVKRADDASSLCGVQFQT